MTTVEKIFGEKVQEVTSEEINWFFDNCVGFPEFEEDWVRSLPKLPEGWETYLWKKYTPDDVVEKYRYYFGQCALYYDEALNNPHNTSYLVRYNRYKSFFLESWISHMVLKMVDKKQVPETEGLRLKKIYFTLALT